MHTTLHIRDTNNGIPSKDIRSIPCIVYGDGKSFIKTVGIVNVVEQEDKTPHVGTLVLVGDLTSDERDENVAGLLFKSTVGIDRMIQVLNMAKQNLEIYNGEIN